MPLSSAIQSAIEWLDGAGSTYASRRQGAGLSGKPLVWHLKPEQPILGGTPVQLVLPRDFPATPARILVDKALCLIFPHVEEDGHVCLGTETHVGDYDDPVGAVVRVIEEFQAFVGHCGDSAWITKEFQRERLSYWKRFCARRQGSRHARPAVKQLYLDHAAVQDYAEGKVALFAANSAAVVCVGEVDPYTLAIRHRLGRGTVVKGRAMFVAMPEDGLWTPTTWPVDITSLDALVLRLTDGAHSVGAWLAQEKTRDPQPFVVVVVQGTVLFAYQLFPALIPRLTLPAIEPLDVDRIDPAWALTRDHGSSVFIHRQASRVLILGCGALGSPITELLARAGIGNIDVVDIQGFEPENVSRHLLGMTAVSKAKATTVAQRLKEEIPGVNIRGFHAQASSWVADRCTAEQYDLVVDCTGESSIRSFLSHYRSLNPTAFPLVHAWLEPFCAAAHVVFIQPSDNWPRSDPADSHVNAAYWPDGTKVEMPACGTGFHPYGVADAWQAAGFTAEQILRVLDGKVTRSSIWSWVRSREFFDALGLEITLREIVPSAIPGLDSVTITREYHDVLADLG